MTPTGRPGAGTPGQEPGHAAAFSMGDIPIDDAILDALAAGTYTGNDDLAWMLNDFVGELESTTPSTAELDARYGASFEDLFDEVFGAAPVESTDSAQSLAWSDDSVSSTAETYAPAALSTLPDATDAATTVTPAASTESAEPEELDELAAKRAARSHSRGRISSNIGWALGGAAAALLGALVLVPGLYAATGGDDPLSSDSLWSVNQSLFNPSGEVSLSSLLDEAEAALNSGDTARAQELLAQVNERLNGSEQMQRIREQLDRIDALENRLNGSSAAATSRPAATVTVTTTAPTTTTVTPAPAPSATVVPSPQPVLPSLPTVPSATATPVPVPSTAPNPSVATAPTQSDSGQGTNPTAAEVPQN